MDSFWERLKDILYDGTDYIIMLVVVLIMILIINWRLDGLFHKNSAQTKQDKQVEDVSKDNDESEPAENVVNEEDIPEEEFIKIDIPHDALPGKIGEILVEYGLVEDKQEFIDKTVEMQADTKLRSGEFEIPKDSTMEEIINILVKK